MVGVWRKDSAVGRFEVKDDSRFRGGTRTVEHLVGSGVVVLSVGGDKFVAGEEAAFDQVQPAERHGVAAEEDEAPDAAEAEDDQHGEDDAFGLDEAGGQGQAFGFVGCGVFE